MISGDCGGVHRYLAELVTKSERYDGVEGIAEVKEQDPDWDANFNWVGVCSG